jgi:WD repeat and SOF domain-containing protein 1
MQRVKTLSRVESDFTKERNSELQKVHRNTDPILRPFERTPEYTMALCH